MNSLLQAYAIFAGAFIVWLVINYFTHGAHRRRAR